jgi:hypothetical protein
MGYAYFTRNSTYQNINSAAKYTYTHSCSNHSITSQPNRYDGSFANTLYYIDAYDCFHT